MFKRLKRGGWQWVAQLPPDVVRSGCLLHRHARNGARSPERTGELAPFRRLALRQRVLPPERGKDTGFELVFAEEIGPLQA